MSMTKRDRMLLLILIGVVILALGFMLVYRPTMTKKAELDAAIELDRQELAELQGYEASLDYYYSEMDRAGRYIQGQMERYPTDVRAEDQIMYAIALRDSAGTDIYSAAFSQPEALLSFLGIEKDGEDYKTTELAAYKTVMNVSCSLGYQDMKDMITYINRTPDRTSLDSLEISFDSGTGGLAGSASISKYFISSPEDVYEATDVPGLELGTDDLFHTVPEA